MQSQPTIVLITMITLFGVTIGQTSPHCKQRHEVHFELTNFSLSGGNCDFTGWNQTGIRQYQTCDLWVRANISGTNMTPNGLLFYNGDQAHVLTTRESFKFTSFYDDAQSNNVTLVVQFADDLDYVQTTEINEQKVLELLQKMESNITQDPRDVKFRCVWHKTHTYLTTNWNSPQHFTEHANTADRYCGSDTGADVGIVITYTFTLQITRYRCTTIPTLMNTTMVTTTTTTNSPTTSVSTGPLVAAKENVTLSSNLTLLNDAGDDVVSAITVGLAVILVVLVVIQVVFIVGFIWSDQFFKFIRC